MAKGGIRRGCGARAIGHLILVAVAWLAAALALHPAQPVVAAEWRTLLAGKNAFLVFTDLHFNPFDDPALVDRLAAAEPAGWQAILESSTVTRFSPYGQDANYRLIASALASMRTTVPNPDFIVFTGDFLGHNFRTLFNQTASDPSDVRYQDFVIKTMRFLGGLFAASFPNVPLVPALGNNDSLCGNYKIEPDGPFLHATADLIRGMIGPAAVAPDFAATWQAGGFYSMPHPTAPGIRLVVLNDIFFTPRYSNDCGQAGSDPGAAELAWLQSTLAGSRSNGEKVWLVYHVPVGIDAFSTVEQHGACPTAVEAFFQPRYAAPFQDLMGAFGDTIQLAVAGHTHKDDFRLIPAGGQAVSYGHIAPAISPVYQQNPAYQVFVYDPANGAIDNVLTFYLTNLPAAGVFTPADWAFEYDFNTAYGQSGLSTAALRAAYRAIGSGGEAQADYMTYYAVSRSYDQEITPANVHSFHCADGNIDSAAYTRCSCGTAAGP